MGIDRIPVAARRGVARARAGARVRRPRRRDLGHRSTNTTSHRLLHRASSPPPTTRTLRLHAHLHQGNARSADGFGASAFVRAAITPRARRSGDTSRSRPHTWSRTIDRRNSRPSFSNSPDRSERLRTARPCRRADCSSCGATRAGRPKPTPDPTECASVGRRLRTMWQPWGRACRSSAPRQDLAVVAKPARLAGVVSPTTSSSSPNATCPATVMREPPRRLREARFGAPERSQRCLSRRSRNVARRAFGVAITPNGAFAYVLRHRGDPTDCVAEWGGCNHCGVQIVSQSLA